MHACMRPCLHPETSLTRYLAEYLTHFHQTNDALWDTRDRDERVTVWARKVKDQGHGGIKYAGNSTFCACFHNVLKSISQIFTRLTPVMCYGTEMNALNVGVKRSKFMVE